MEPDGTAITAVMTGVRGYFSATTTALLVGLLSFYTHESWRIKFSSDKRQRQILPFGGNDYDWLTDWLTGLMQKTNANAYNGNI